MADYRLSNTVASVLAQAWVDAIDADTDPGYFEVYAGSIPATPQTAIGAQVKLGTLTFSATCGTVADGIVTFNAITGDAGADASGSPGFVRVYDGAGTVIGDYSCSDSAGDGPFKFNTLTVESGGPITATAGGTMNFKGY